MEVKFQLWPVGKKYFQQTYKKSKLSYYLKNSPKSDKNEPREPAT